MLNAVGDIAIELYIKSNVAVPAAKIREFDVVWKVVSQIFG